MTNKRIFLDSESSEIVRENLRPLIGRITSLAPIKGGRESLNYYARLRARLNGKRGFRVDELEPLAKRLMVKTEDLLRPRFRAAKLSDLRYFEPDSAYTTGDQAKQKESLRVLESAFKRGGTSSTLLKSANAWPGLTIPDTQRRSINRHKLEGHRLMLEARADWVRTTWGLGQAPISSFTWVLARAGVMVRNVDLQPRRSETPAVSGKLGDMRFIGLTAGFAALSWVRKREILALQIGRLYFKDESEAGLEAARFARALLLPLAAKQLCNELDESPTALIKCAQAYGISPQWMLARFNEWLVGDEKWRRKRFERLQDRELPPISPWSEEVFDLTS